MSAAGAGFSRLALGFLAAPLAVVLLNVMMEGSTASAPNFAILAYSAMLLMGVPAYWALRRAGLPGFWATTSFGFVLGLLPFLATVVVPALWQHFGFSAPADAGARFYAEGELLWAAGRLTGAGFLALGKGLVYFGMYGAVAGAVFWMIAIRPPGRPGSQAGKT